MSFCHVCQDLCAMQRQTHKHQLERYTWREHHFSLLMLFFKGKLSCRFTRHINLNPTCLRRLKSQRYPTKCQILLDKCCVKSQCPDVPRAKNPPFLMFGDMRLVRRTSVRPIKDNPAIIEEKLDDFQEGGGRRQYQSRPI